jgi:hypothetical protein
MDLAALSHKGFVLIPHVFDAAARRRLAEPFDELLALLVLKPLWPFLQGVMKAPLALRAVSFQKTAQANWVVGPHQDRSVPVPGPHPPRGFQHVTRRKNGWRGEAPLSLLRQMCNARIYLDKAEAEDGPFEVIPGSHRLGRIPKPEIIALAEKSTWKAMTGEAGDLMLLSPLLIHRSRIARAPPGRRVLQVEFLPQQVARVFGLMKG